MAVGVWSGVGVGVGVLIGSRSGGRVVVVVRMAEARVAMDGGAGHARLESV